MVCARPNYDRNFMLSSQSAQFLEYVESLSTVLVLKVGWLMLATRGDIMDDVSENRTISETEICDGSLCINGMKSS